MACVKVKVEKFGNSHERCEFKCAELWVCAWLPLTNTNERLLETSG